MIRQFKLTNALGQTYNLNEQSSFFHNMKGLGQEHKVTYIQLGTQFLKEKEYLSQKGIQGKMYFDTYRNFFSFSNFIQHKPLILTYKSADTYCIRVSIDKLEKTELETGGLYCNILLKSLGTYYKPIKVENSQDKSEIGKQYPFKYPYTYRDTASGILIIESDSVLPSPMKISIFGPCVNPSYTQYVNDVLRSSGKVNVSIPEGNKLVIDTTEIPYSIRQYTIDNEFVQDMYSKSDFSTDRFITLEYGKNKISFVHESSGSLNVSIEARIEYESV